MLSQQSEAPQQAPRDRCLQCGASVEASASECPQCHTAVPVIGRRRRRHHESRGRRYVYGKRKHQLSQEMIWLIVVITLGLLIVFMVQLLAFMRSKKLLLAPTPQRLVLVAPGQSAPPPQGALRAPRRPATVPQPARDYEVTRNADRLRNLCHAGPATGAGHPRAGAPGLPGDRDLPRGPA